MDVRLPDGTLIRGVPDGMSKADLVAKLERNGMSVPAEWKAPKVTGAQMRAKETGADEAFLAGAGSKVNDILNGLTQRYLQLRGDDKALGGLAQNVASEAEPMAALKSERPISTGLGGALPAMAIPGAGAGYGGAMLAGALPELMSYGTGQEVLSRGAVGAAGGAAGRAIGGGIASLLKPAGVGVNTNTAAIEAAKRIGFKPMAGQATQNPAMLNVENYLARSPGSSGIMQALNEANKTALNRAAAKSIGQSADDVGAGTLSAAEKAIGASYERLQAVTAPKLGDEFVGSLAKIEASNAARGPFRDPAIDSLLDKAMDLAAKGNLSGAAYKEIRTELSNQATKAFKGGDATLGKAVKTVRKALDDAAEKSLSKVDQEAWRVAREQWGNWKVLTEGMVSEAGDVSAARVAAQMRQQGPGFRTGAVQGPLADVGRIGEGIKGALNPNSGTLPQMMLYGNPITGVPLSVGNFAAAHAYTSPIVQKYLRDGLIDIGTGGDVALRTIGVPGGIFGTKQFLGAN